MKGSCHMSNSYDEVGHLVLQSIHLHGKPLTLTRFAVLDLEATLTLSMMAESQSFSLCQQAL